MKTIITSQRNVAVHILRVLLGLFQCFHFSELADQTSSVGNFTFNQNCPATSVNSYITCKELVVFFLAKTISFSKLLVRLANSNFWKAQ